MKSANQGYVLAQFNLANLYSEDIGAKQSYTQAIKWYLEAAKQGFPSAQYNLGYAYVNGQGVRQDYDKAKYWYGKACDNGMQSGCDSYRIIKENE